jgi:hypothetical protein
MDSIESPVTRRERIAQAQQVGISKPFSIGVVILAATLLVACSMIGVLTQSPWFLFTAVALLEAFFCVAFMFHEDYKMLNDGVRSNRRRERERNTTAARRRSERIATGLS